MDKRLPLVISRAQALLRSRPNLLSFLKQVMEELSELNETERAIRAHELIDQYIEEELKEFKPSCHKGCHFCCYHQIELTPNELSLIKDLKPKLNDHTQACALLDSNGNCTVYPQRPIVCRLTYVTSQNEYCKLDSGEAIEHVPFEKAALVGLAYYSLENELVSLKIGLLL